MAEFGALPGALEALLARDGSVLEGAGENKLVSCWNKAGHANGDRNPSMSVNVATSQYNCFGCGATGDAITYLREVHGMTFEDAKNELIGMGWTDERVAESKRQTAAESRKKKGATAKYFSTPISILTDKNGEERGREIMRHKYHTADGTFIGMKIRYRPTPPYTEKGFPKLYPWTPASQGGWWMTVPDSKTMPEADRFTGKLPLYRLPELIERLKGTNHETQIWIVEGEKKVDAILGSEGFPNTGPPPTTCLWGGFEKTPARLDLSALDGRKVLLVADTDAIGVAKFTKLGHYLRKNLNCTVKVVLPEGEGGYDIADAIGEGGFKQGIKWISNVGGAKDLPEEEPQETLNSVLEEALETGDIPKAMEQNRYFRVLGISDGLIALRKNNTMEILLYNPNQLIQPTTFTRLADLEFWVSLCAPKAFSNHYRLVCVDAILRVADTKGIVDLTRAVLGRGGFYLNNRPHYYLGGSRVLSADEEGLLTQEEDINHLGQVLRPGPEIRSKGDDNAKEWARELYDTMLDYRWATSFDGHVFLGWLVTSLIGGLLPFRPMVWLVAPPESGKTFLHTPILKQIMDNALWVAGDQTAAAIIEHMRDNSLPIWIDEFEPGVGRKDDRFRDIMALIRLATSGEAEYARGGPAKSLNARPRFSAICSSVNQATMSLADETRFVTIRFNRKGVDDWTSLESRIAEVVQPERGAAIRHRIIEHAGEVAKLAEHKAGLLRADADVSTRSAQIYGALSAGAAFLASDDEILLKPQPTHRAGEDEWRPFEILMTTPLPFRGSASPISMAEAVGELIGMDKALSSERKKWERDELEAFLSRYGMRWFVNGSYHALCFAHTSEALRLVLRNTEFANLSVAKYLTDLPGIERGGKLRIGHKTHRCLALGLDTLQEQGFFKD